MKVKTILKFEHSHIPNHQKWDHAEVLENNLIFN